MRMAIYVREETGTSVYACCPAIPGLCVIGDTADSAIESLSRKIAQLISDEPSLASQASVRFLEIQVADLPSEAPAIVRTQPHSGSSVDGGRRKT